MADHNQTVSAGTRIYYIDARDDGKGNRYLSIAEMNTRTKERTCIFVYAEHLEAFRRALDEAAANVSKS